MVFAGYSLFWAEQICRALAWDRLACGFSKIERVPRGGRGEGQGHKSPPLIEVYRGGGRRGQSNRQSGKTKVTREFQIGNGLGGRSDPPGHESTAMRVGYPR